MNHMGQLRLVALMNTVSGYGEEFSVDGVDEDQPIRRRNHYHPEDGWRVYTVTEAECLLSEYANKAALARDLIAKYFETT